MYHLTGNGGEHTLTVRPREALVDQRKKDQCIEVGWIKYGVVRMAFGRAQDSTMAWIDKACSARAAAGDRGFCIHGTGFRQGSNGLQTR